MRRWGARWVDWLVVWLLSSPLWFVAGHFLQTGVSEHAARLAGKGAFDIVFGKWGGLDDVGLDALAGYWGTVVLIVVGTLTAQVVLVAAYEAVFVCWCGRTLGKTLFSLTVIRAGTAVSGGARLTFGRACARAVLAVLLPGMAWVLLILAVLQMSFLLGLAGVLLLVWSVVDCCVLRGSPEGQTSWHDRRTGSVVVRISWMDQLRQVRDFQQRAVQQGVTWAQAAWNAPQAQQIVQHAQTAFQQVQNSPAAARIQDQGKKAIGTVRDSAWGKAVEGRAKDLRSHAAGEPAQPPVDDTPR